MLGPIPSTALPAACLKAQETEIVMKPVSGFATEFPCNQEDMI